MKISIITPSSNQGKFIEKCIQSVLEQDYPNFEHIIIDGGSTDNTIDILKKYSHLKWVSEKDEGQADALNKGLKMATGDIIGWINSDDYYLPNAFKVISKYFVTDGIKWLIGNLKSYYSTIDKTVDVKSPRISYNLLLKNPDIVEQPNTFFRKYIIEQSGGWNKKYHMVLDYDLWVRIAKIVSPLMIDDYLAVFTWHPGQKTNYLNIFKQIKELIEILKRERVSYIYILKLILTKSNNLLRSYIKSIFIKFNLIDKRYQEIPFPLRKL